MAPQRGWYRTALPCPEPRIVVGERSPSTASKGGAAPESTSPDLGACGGERVATHAGPAPGGTPSQGIAGPDTASSAVTGHVAGPMRIRIGAPGGARAGTVVHHDPRIGGGPRQTDDGSVSRVSLAGSTRTVECRRSGYGYGPAPARPRPLPCSCRPLSSRRREPATTDGPVALISTGPGHTDAAHRDVPDAVGRRPTRCPTWARRSRKTRTRHER
jgi:hypothetical protein